MPNFINILSLLLCSSSCIAQQSLTLFGTIRESQAKNTLPFTVISIKNSNQATAADEQGDSSFSFIKSQNDTIVFSRLGYQEKEIPVSSLSNFDSLFIELQQEAFNLPPIVVNGLSAKEIVRKAIENLNRNFPDTNLLLSSFYRQYHKEDDHYVRLIEAVVITNEQPYQNYNHTVKSEKVSIDALRRSDVFETNKAQHGDHLLDLLNENPFKFPVGGVLNPKGIEYFNFHFVESNITGLLVIEFSSVLTSTLNIQQGQLYIDENTFFIKRLVTETIPNPNSKVQHFAASGEAYLWKLRNGKYDISLRQLSRQTVFDRIIKNYTHYLIDTRVNSLAHIVEENFELQSSTVVKDDELTNRFSSTSNLYLQQYIVHADDWKDFPLLPKEIQNDLEKDTILKDQFIKNGK